MDCPTASDIVASLDAYIRGGTHADTPFGTTSNLLLKGDPDLEFARKTYLVFDLSTAPADFSTATLVLTLERHVDRRPADLSGVMDNDDWDPNALAEDAITWTNAPRNDASSAIAFTGQGSSSANGVRVLVPRYNFDLADPPEDPDPPGTQYAFDATDFVKWAVGPDGDEDGYVTLVLALSDVGKADGTALRSRDIPEDDDCERPFLHFE